MVYRDPEPLFSQGGQPKTARCAHISSGFSMSTRRSSKFSLKPSVVRTRPRPAPIPSLRTVSAPSFHKLPLHARLPRVWLRRCRRDTHSNQDIPTPASVVATAAPAPIPAPPQLFISTNVVPTKMTYPSRRCPLHHHLHHPLHHHLRIPTPRPLPHPSRVSPLPMAKTSSWRDRCSDSRQHQHSKGPIQSAVTNPSFSFAGPTL